MEEVKDMREIFVCGMLLMAGIDDMKRNRISNCIVIPAIILSVIYKVYFDGFLYAMRGIKDMTLICLIFLPVFKLNKRQDILSVHLRVMDTKNP